MAFRAIPVEPADVEAMIGETGLGVLLDGFRRGTPYDRDALVAAALAVSDYAAGNAEWLAGLEINPLRVLPRGQGVLALDALVNRRGDRSNGSRA